MNEDMFDFENLKVYQKSLEVRSKKKIQDTRYNNQIITKFLLQNLLSAIIK